MTAGYLEGFYHRPRIDKALLKERSEGLMGLSAWAARSPRSCSRTGTRTPRRSLSIPGHLGQGEFLFELPDNGIPEQEQVNRELIRLGRDLNVPLVATNDCHYLDMGDHKSHDALLCIQTGKIMKDANRMRFSSETFYVKTPEEMKKSFSHIPEAISNTVKIAERCNLGWSSASTISPTSPFPKARPANPTWQSWREKASKSDSRRSRPCAGAEASTARRIRKGLHSSSR